MIRVLGLCLEGTFCLPIVLNGKEPACQCRRRKRRGFDPCVGRIPLESRKWQSIAVCLLGKFHGQRRLQGYSPWGHKELDTTERTHIPPLFLLMWLSILFLCLKCTFLHSFWILNTQVRKRCCLWQSQLWHSVLLNLPVLFQLDHRDLRVEMFPLCFLFWEWLA